MSDAAELARRSVRWAFCLGFLLAIACLAPAVWAGLPAETSATGGAADAKPGAGASARPNFILFLTDDQRNDLMGVAGHPILQTPNIDRLAKRGVRFSHMFVTTPICAASRASILTGLHERTHKFTFQTPPISAAHCEISYPAQLRKAGYVTALYGKFGVQIPPAQRQAMFDELKPLSPPFNKKQPDGSIRHIDVMASDMAVDFLRRRADGKPFCLSISFNSPHAEDGSLDFLYPYAPGAASLYEKTEIPVPAAIEEERFAALPPFLRSALNRKRWYWQFDAPVKFQRNVRDYYRMISGIDQQIGRIVDELQKQGLDRDTVLIFTSDNGYFLGEMGLSGKWVHYDASLRVPLIIHDPRLPAVRAGKVEAAMALNIDLAPTILSMAGIAPPPAMQGRTLQPLLEGKTPADWRTDLFGEHLFDHPDIPKWEGVRGTRWVYARYFQQNPPYEFLHDLEADPEELKNLAHDPAMARTLESMRRRTLELRDPLGGEWTPEKFPRAKPAPAKPAPAKPATPTPSVPKPTP